MRRLAVVWWTMGGVWFWATGCNSEPKEAEPVPVQSFAAAFSKAQCDEVERCCSLSNFAFDRVNCEGRLKASFQASLDVALMGPVDYDESVAGKCLADLNEQQSCGVPLLEFPVCKGMLVGRLEDGQACDRNVTCKSGWCAQLGDGAESVCTALQYSGPVIAGKAGDDCVDTCEAPGNCPPIGSTETLVACYRTDGLFCGYSAELQSQQCQRLLEIGEACEGDRHCAPGLFCQDVCEAPHPDGASCEYDDECRSGVCLDGECQASAFSEDACASGGTTL